MYDSPRIITLSCSTVTTMLPPRGEHCLALNTVLFNTLHQYGPNTVCADPEII